MSRESCCPGYKRKGQGKGKEKVAFIQLASNFRLGYLPGGHLPPPNSDISHPPKKTFARRTTATPNFFFFFWRTFLGFFDLQLMEDNKDGKEEVLDEVVMEHIK